MTTKALSDTTSESASRERWTARLATWGSFAAAASATLASAGNAEASIIYVHPNSPITLQLPGVAPYNPSATEVVAPVTIDGQQFNVNIGGSGLSPFAGVSGGAIQWFSNTGLFLNNFASGQAIGGANERTGPGFFFCFNSQSCPGNFPVDKTGFAGFQLPSAQGSGDGWMRVSMIDRDNNGRVDEVQIIDWAYNNAGGSITAGEGLPTGTPEPDSTSLSLLALGASGILAWRRRRAAAQDAQRQALP